MPYVKNAWYVASWAQDLAPAKPFAIAILNQPIVIYRPSESEPPVALADRCVHRLAPLSLGRCEGRSLRCMYHGLLFGPDGKVEEIPGQAQIPDKARVRHYPVVERHSWIWVWMGEPAAADPALIPPAVGFDDPAWILGRGYLDYDAAASLINDNLLDFSHLSYVHASSFQASETWAKVRPTISPLERGIRYQRWIENEKAMTAMGGQSRDGWTSYDFVIPGILLMRSQSFPVGTAKACGYKAPPASAKPEFQTFTSQAVTPLTDGTARYFFSWGPHKDCGDDSVRDKLMAVAAQAFAEDKTMIEAQHRVIRQTPSPEIMPIAADKGVTLFNRLVERLAREEAAQTDRAA